MTARLARRLLRSPAFTERAVVIHRETGERGDFGAWRKGAVVEIPVMVAIVVPDDGEERLIETVGIRSEELLKFYLLPPVNGPTADWDSDVIRYDGREYRAVQVRRWGRGGYVEVVGQRRDGI